MDRPDCSEKSQSSKDHNLIEFVQWELITGIHDEALDVIHSIDATVGAISLLRNLPAEGKTVGLITKSNWRTNRAQALRILLRRKLSIYEAATSSDIVTTLCLMSNAASKNLWTVYKVRKYIIKSYTKYYNCWMFLTYRWMLVKTTELVCKFFTESKWSMVTPSLPLLRTMMAKLQWRLINYREEHDHQEYIIIIIMLR